ncbi:hypothetical protein CNMCM7691_006171 [Aspergillus felis]|uniref:Potassium transport protein n=1 Tax=Aspergillus felis TaxID=1287682 RepID=A0A8H6QT17_9EURO|nr:hypothetical protein CNMCM7691_006171 [Aspergillus felis]
MDETTPLLPGQNDHNNEDSTTTQRTTSSRIVTILIWSSVIISALTFLYSLTVYLVVTISPYYEFLPWGIRECAEPLLPLSFLCAVASLFGVFKLTVPNGGAWLLVNLIFDPLILVLFCANPALRTPGVANWGQCDGHGHGFPAPGFEERCDVFANAIKAAILVGLVFDMVIMSLYLVFFIRDVVLGVKRLSQLNWAWRLPTVEQVTGMWKPSLNFISLNFITLHSDAYIITLSVLSLAIIYPYGNLRAIDAFFFGASASTESGLNTVDINRLKTYQQVYIYIAPIISNLGFINILVVIVRLRWFEKRLKEIAPAFLRQRRKDDAEAGGDRTSKTVTTSDPTTTEKQDSFRNESQSPTLRNSDFRFRQDSFPNESQSPPLRSPEARLRAPSITFADNVHDSSRDRALYVPPPWQRDRGHPIVEVDDALSDCERTKSTDPQTNAGISRRRFNLARTETIERVASTMFVLGPSPSQGPKTQTQPLDRSLSQQLDLPELSSHATIGRNSQFYNLTDEDREMLGGIEYRSLKLLLKIVTGYFFGLHLFGAICLVGWIQHANPKYRDYLAQCGQGNIWWAFYSSQTMIDNLGFTLTPDSMVSFQDATFPLIVMSFLALAGNTLYPCLLRFIIWTMSKLCPRNSSMKESLLFLLNHPRRCYTLLFPSKPTWVLFGIIFTMNLVDVILIIVLDLHNSAVNVLPAGPRVLAAINQAASTRHTGTAVFNLANVNPAVQFSLLVMMYIAVYPIAISVRASNTYEERALGIYADDAATIDESDGRSYVLAHIRNQLTFDLWYIFLGIFCICIAESDRVMDPNEPSFAVFPIFFEVVSAYANVGLSLGYPTVNTSLCGQFSVFSKLVICAMMIRGRHRGLPYQLDRAIVLPNEQLDDSIEGADDVRSVRRMGTIKRFHTS